ncbi:restriction endonuclease [Streptomyces huiliensis]|uniref:restriction endonuclease n=1 Tax=Streptomyces huiliensis TaxID=2876027 RepID=UPI001CC04793|nr:restriction endonuclease [Streptomyces huiliensis]MBZ4323396.1 restriction endonuclease [Streptomyces huiliensis]
MSRRPRPRRRPRPGPRTRKGRRRQRTGDRLTGLLVAAVLAVVLVAAVVDWLTAHWWVMAATGALALSAGGAVLHRKRQRARWEAVRARGLRYALPQLDALHHARFEEAVRDLMRRDGYRDAVRVGGGGDLGADVKATDPYGRRWVIQCKHRRGGPAGSAVGTPDLQVLNGTARPVHGADVAVIVTNGRVTGPAVAFARQQRLHVVDRPALGVWASGSRPLWELLAALPPSRRPTARP